jgi:hypothetical protein
MLARRPKDAPADVDAKVAGKNAGRERGSVWPWAVATISLVTLIVTVTFGVRLLTSNAQRAALGMAAPQSPPMHVVAIAQPEGGAALFAVDSGAGRLVTLARSSDVTCPPIGLCPAPSIPDALVILDGGSGATLSTTPLTGNARAAQDAGALLVDSSAHLAYAVSSRSVVIFSTQNGARVGGYDLPRDLGGGSFGGAALDVAHNTLALADPQRLMLVKAGTGVVKATQKVPPAAYVDGPVLDSTHNRLYVASRSDNRATTLAGFDAQTLQPTGQYTLPSGVRLGPADAEGALFLFGADGATWRLAPDAAPNASQSPQSAPLTRDTSLPNALALGENSKLAHHYMLTANSERIIASKTGATLAALPLTAPWRSTAPIPVDASKNLVYLPADHGAIVIVRDGESNAATLTSSAAIILARDGLRAFYVQGPSALPVLSPTLFSLQPGHIDQGLWFLPSGGTSWVGPYPGSAVTAINSAGQESAPGYQVHFSLAWTDPDTGKYTHDWVWRVQPTGALDLLSQY